MTFTRLDETSVLPAPQAFALEVLAARAATGEPGWKFPSRYSYALNGLVHLGLVVSSPLPDGVFAELTTAGLAYATPFPHTSPAERALRGLLAGHHRYLPAAYDTDCCSECNRVTNSYVDYPCDLRTRVEAVLELMHPAPAPVPV